MHPELLIDVVAVSLHCTIRKVETLGNVMIGKTLLKKLSDFVFSRTHFRENLLDSLFGQRALRL